MQVRHRVSAPGWTVVFLVGWLVGTSAQAVHPLSGTWKLNLAKSTFSPASLAAKSSISKIEVSGDSIHLINDAVDPQGRATHMEYTAKFDGKGYPWKGTIDGKPNPDQDGIIWKKIDDRTYEVANTLKGATLTTMRVVLAPDGRTRTNTVTGKNAKGQVVNHIQVYEKQ